MKYSIEGIDKTNIIKSTQILETSSRTGESKPNKAIMVNYLDGTQDVFEFTKENLDTIKEIAEAQAEIYIKNKDKKIVTIAAVRNINVGLIIISLLLVITLASTLLKIGVIAAFSILITIIISVSNRKIKDIKKYDLYVNNIKNKLESYKEILAKEQSLVKSKNKNVPKLENVFDLDKVSLKQLEEINNKVERYNEIDGKSPKKKSL